MSVDKERLFENRADTKTGFPEDDMELPGLGSIRVRGLSRGEVFAVQEYQSTAVAERKILACGMVDPPMSMTEVGRWQEASPAGELEPVVDRIRELSGLTDGSDKQAYRSFRGGPGSGVRDVPGDEAGDDGGGAAGADEQR